jgi:choline dehydrogenase-like flavoprotein
LNSGDGIGVKQGSVALDSRYQRSSGYCYYERAKGRPNLKVIHHAPAQAITFRQTQGNEKPCATGVVFMDSAAGLFRTISVNKEVILALGAVQTPQLLMVSVCLPAKVLVFGIETDSVE